MNINNSTEMSIEAAREVYANLSDDWSEQVSDDPSIRAFNCELEIELTPHSGLDRVYRHCCYSLIIKDGAATLFSHKEVRGVDGGVDMSIENMLPEPDPYDVY